MTQLHCCPKHCQVPWGWGRREGAAQTALGEAIPLRVGLLATWGSLERARSAKGKAKESSRKEEGVGTCSHSLSCFIIYLIAISDDP